MSSPRMEEFLKNPFLMLVLNACVTYGVLTTQLQWIRSDLDRQEQQIKRIENKLFFEPARKSNEKILPPVAYSCNPNDARLREFALSMGGKLFIG